MRGAALVASALAAAAFAAGCGDDGRGDVEAYIKRANEVQRRAEPRFAAADRAYKEFAQGRLARRGAGDRLASVERSIRAVRVDVARLDPPKRAKALHAKLLRVYDLNVGLAHETTQLAAYPAAARAAVRGLGPAQRRFRRRLGTATTASAQARAFRDYGAALSQAGDGLERVDAPPLIAEQRDQQVRRLKAARALASRLRRAVEGGDSKATARLLLRFRDLERQGPADARFADALAAYTERYRQLAIAEADVRREKVRLEQSFR